MSYAYKLTSLLLHNVLGPALRSGWPEGPDPGGEAAAGPSEQRAPKHSGGRPKLKGGRGPQILKKILIISNIKFFIQRFLV